MVSAGDQISFDVEVTNTGAGNAYVSVSDPLPTTAGTGWTIDAANTTGAWSIVNDTLQFGPATLAPKASFRVRIVSGTTGICTTIPNLANLTYRGGTGSDDSSVLPPTRNCADLPNVAAISATKEAASATGNKRDDASIAVLCPSVSITKTNNSVVRGGSARRPPGINPAGRQACRNRPLGPGDPDGTCRA